MTLSVNEKMVQGSVQDTDGRLVIGNNLFNGIAFEAYRGTLELNTLITAVGATTTQSSPDLTNWNHRGIVVFLNVTSIGTGNISVSVNQKDTVSGGYSLMQHTGTNFTAVTANGLYVYAVYPGINGNGYTDFLNAILPRNFRIQVLANNANPTSYTVGASLIL